MQNNFQKTKDVVVGLKKYYKGKTLDLGAGTAKYRNIIKPNVTEYITCDMFPGENVDIVENVLDLSFDDSSFDTVISTQVMEHVSRPWVMMQEVARILRKDGHCIITAPFLVPYHADPYDYYRYTTEGMKALADSVGLEVVEVGSYGRSGIVFSEFLHFTLFNPYKKLNKTRSKLFGLIQKFLFKIDKIFSEKSPIYANVFLVAKKVK